MANINVCDFPHAQQAIATHKIVVHYDDDQAGGNRQELDACDTHFAAFQARITNLLGP